MIDAFFISDAHLGIRGNLFEQERFRRVCDFLDRGVSGATHLFILGDLFDFWFEYRCVIPRFLFGILSRLKWLSTQGLEIHYVAGNHDFALGDFLEGEVGIHTHLEPLERTIGSKRFYIAHGDGIDPKDIGYRCLKKIVRHPVSWALFRWVHPDWGIAFAQTLSNASRNSREIKDRDALYTAFARRKFAEGFDCVVLGHTHRPQWIEEGPFCYVNLGDWMTSTTYGRFDGERLTLETWNPEKNG